MTTTGQRLVSLSGLPTGTAMHHLAAIAAGPGGPVYVGPVADADAISSTASAELVFDTYSATVTVPEMVAELIDDVLTAQAASASSEAVATAQTQTAEA